MRELANGSVTYLEFPSVTYLEFMELFCIQVLLKSTSLSSGCAYEL